MARQKRNMPCACGSGKKYKNCCMKAVRTKEQRRTFVDRIRARLEDFHTDERFRSDLRRAIEQHPDADSDTVEHTMLEWYEHDYILERYGKTIIELFAEENRDDLSSTEADMLSRWVRSPMSIYEVTEVTRGLGVRLRDVFGRTEHFVHDSNASLSLEEHSYLSARLYDTGDMVMTSGVSELVLPTYKDRIVEFVQDGLRKAGHGDVRRYLKENSLDVVLLLRTLQSTPPLLTNSDDDPVSIAIAHYAVGAPCRDICDMLETADGMMRTHGADGRYAYHLVEEDIGHAPPTTVHGEAAVKVFTTFVSDGKKFNMLANIEFDQHAMEVFCYSDQRLHETRAMLEDLLGSAIEHKEDVIKDVQSAIAEMKQGRS